MKNPEARRILVVDDERSIADSATTILRISGYDAEAHYNGATALVECESRIPDLVLSDVMMPGLNGVELALRIRRLSPTCPILLFSGLGTSLDLVSEANQLGHNFELLAKPVPPRELLARIASLLARETSVRTLSPTHSPAEFTPGIRPVFNIREGADRTDSREGKNTRFG